MLKKTKKIFDKIVLGTGFCHNRAFFRKCVTAVWVKDKVQHDHRIQS